MRGRPRATARVGIDIGGTFTDAVLATGGQLHVAKVPTTPGDFGQGFMEALSALPTHAADVGNVAHGTTIATNAIVQGRTARVALVTTEGFRDTLEIGTQLRAHLYDLRAPNPPPLVPRELRFEVAERVGPQGEVVRELDDADVAGRRRSHPGIGRRGDRGRVPVLVPQPGARGAGGPHPARSAPGSR